MQRRIAALAVAAGALAVPAAAQAHVTVQPTSAPAGAETVLTVRVPNERDDASTVKVDVKLPPGFVSASWEAVPGWSVRAVKQKLSKPDPDRRRADRRAGRRDRVDRGGAARRASRPASSATSRCRS